MVSWLGYFGFVDLLWRLVGVVPLCAFKVDFSCSLWSSMADNKVIVVTTTPSSDNIVAVSADEYAEFVRYKKLLKSPSPQSPITAIAGSGKSIACLSSSSKWVIDSGASDHMTGNQRLFSNFKPYATTSRVTLADGSTSCVIGSGTVNPTPSLPLSSVLSLPNFSFNLLSVSKLTRALNCCISFFPDHCLFQDLTTKRIIGRGHVSKGLYMLDSQLP